MSPNLCEDPNLLYKRDSLDRRHTRESVGHVDVYRAAARDLHSLRDYAAVDCCRAPAGAELDRLSREVQRAGERRVRAAADHVLIHGAWLSRRRILKEQNALHRA